MKRGVHVDVDHYIITHFLFSSYENSTQRILKSRKKLSLSPFPNPKNLREKSIRGIHVPQGPTEEQPDPLPIIEAEESAYKHR
uniref:Uncharacterized protein n=1 Tax=Strigamia maritima TaxID=126957 RepID=T1J9X1_STRMM